MSEGNGAISVVHLTFSLGPCWFAALALLVGGVRGNCSRPAAGEEEGGWMEDEADGGDGRG